jgi:4-amino-4-deoxy-L-arabinose transferase-like glycosyltransferase
MTGTKPGGRWMVESVDLSASTTAEGNARRERWAAAAAVTAVALAVRLIHLDTPPFVDELFHVLAAKSYLADGTLEIADGSRPYVRARLYTMLVAGMFAWFGEGLVQARIPAVVAGALLVGVVYMWVHSVAGRWPAVISSLLFCFQPGALSLSQIGRFYTLATLFLWLGFLAARSCIAAGRPGVLPARHTLAPDLGRGNRRGGDLACGVFWTGRAALDAAGLAAPGAQRTGARGRARRRPRARGG